MYQLAPIALFVFKRLEHTKRTLEALSENVLAQDSDLIIFADGPRNPAEAIETDAVRQFIRGVTGFKSVRIVEQSVNRGLASSIIAGVNQVIAEFGKIIVIEDDLVTSEHFLDFMNAGLEKYQDEHRVGCIHGFVYPLKNSMEKPFFLRGGDCWGWATWKRSWDLFEENGEKLLREIKDTGLTQAFDHDNSYPFTQMLKDQVREKNNSWAIRWHASLFLANRLCLYPHETLVENIGFDGTGTHCIEQRGISSNEFSHQRAAPALDDVLPEASPEAYESFRQHFIETLGTKTFRSKLGNRLGILLRSIRV